MAYLPLAYLHLATVLPAAVIGGYLLLVGKGTPIHKLLGRDYMLLMLFTAVVTLCMTAVVGPTLLGHFGFIHAFSLLVLISIPRAYLAIRRGDLEGHKYANLGVYFGGILIAGGFALSPGRLLHGWLFGS